MTKLSEGLVAIYILAPLLGFYFLILEFRRHRFRILAKKLSARYISEGLFKTGKITGNSDGREFEIITVSGGGEGRGLNTKVSIGCTNKGISLIIKSPFFKDFPSWDNIATWGPQSQRVFFTSVTFKDAPVPLDESCQQKVLRAFSGLEQDIIPPLNSIGKGWLHIDAGQVTWERRGVLNNPIQIETILKLVKAVSKRIELSPISKEAS